jgi:glutamine phosphoribosylpyrophosphate amidotransferase
VEYPTLIYADASKYLAASKLHEALDVPQHQGQDVSGIVMSFDSKNHQRKDNGLTSKTLWDVCRESPTFPAT